MLTASNWFTEPISNRYHYATRLSRILPVIFVQPDLKKRNFWFENTEFSGITILHVFNGNGFYSLYGRETNELINLALIEKGFIAPLLWTNNAYFLDFYRSRFSPLKIFHAHSVFFLIVKRNNREYNEIRQIQQEEFLPGYGRTQ